MEKYDTFQLFKQGAEAKIYAGTFLGRKAVLKERFSKKYRHPDLDRQINRDRLKAEVRSLMRCKAAGVRTPTLYAVEPERGLLVMEHLEGRPTVRNFIEDRLSAGDADALKKVSREIGRLVAVLHKNAIVHGDITPSNILVEKAGEDPTLCFIDFGLGGGQASPEDKGVDLYVLERALISTHPAAKFMFDEVVAGYGHEYRDRKKDRGAILAKFEEVRLRGRKREMIG